jgi:hypothetical protein
METPANMSIRNLTMNDPPLRVAVPTVEYGFVVVPPVLKAVINRRVASDALLGSYRQLWEDVLRAEPSIRIIFLMSGNPADLTGVVKALNQIGKYEGRSLAFDFVGANVGGLPIDFLAGFAWKSADPELVCAAPDTILPA